MKTSDLMADVYTCLVDFVLLILIINTQGKNACVLYCVVRVRASERMLVVELKN